MARRRSAANDVNVENYDLRKRFRYVGLIGDFAIEQPDLRAEPRRLLRGDPDTAGELGKLKRGKHDLYILDEATTGLHFADIDRLLESLNRLVNNGHSVVVIEHNLDVIKTADHVIDLGPKGGHNGGELIACGTPEQIAACKRSRTGKYLAVVVPLWVG